MFIRTLDETTIHQISWESITNSKVVFSNIVALRQIRISDRTLSAFMNRLKLEISRADLSVSLLYSSFSYQLIPSINLFGVVPRDGCLSHRHLNSDYFGGNICRRSAVRLSHGSGQEEADPAKRSEWEGNHSSAFYELHVLPKLALLNHSNAEATFIQSYKNTKIVENHLNPVMLVFIGKLSLSTLRWVPIFQGLSHFSGFLHCFFIGQIGHQQHKG